MLFHSWQRECKDSLGEIHLRLSGTDKHHQLLLTHNLTWFPPDIQLTSTFYNWCFTHTQLKGSDSPSRHKDMTYGILLWGDFKHIKHDCIKTLLQVWRAPFAERFGAAALLQDKQLNFKGGQKGWALLVVSYTKCRISLNPQHGGITGTNRDLTSETAVMVVALDWPLGRSIIPTHLSLLQEIVHPPQLLQSLLCFLKTHTKKRNTMKTFCTRHCKPRHGRLQNILAAAPPTGQNRKRWNFAAFTHLRPRKKPIP